MTHAGFARALLDLRLLGRRVEECADGLEGDREPIGAVAQLVDDLVERLVEQEGDEDRVGLVNGTECLRIAPQELVAALQEEPAA